MKFMNTGPHQTFSLPKSYHMMISQYFHTSEKFFCGMSVIYVIEYQQAPTSEENPLLYQNYITSVNTLSQQASLQATDGTL
jgi:hypothetical protein